MKIVASASRTGISVILSCNLCSWTPNYPTSLIPPSQHLTSHSTAAPIIEPNQDFSQLNLQLAFFCFSFVSPCRTAQLSVDQAGSGSQVNLQCWDLSGVFPVLGLIRGAASPVAVFLFCQSGRQKGSICVWRVSRVSANNLEDFSCQVETFKPSSNSESSSLN